jgi:hypothetical protein
MGSTLPKMISLQADFPNQTDREKHRQKTEKQQKKIFWIHLKYGMFILQCTMGTSAHDLQQHIR